MSIWPVRVMIYGAGAAINGANELNAHIHAQLSNLGHVATNQYVAAVAQLNSSAATSFRYVLDPFGRQSLTQLRDFNTGDPQPLIDFVEWGATTCPASQAVLVLSGHGAAWQDDLASHILQPHEIIAPSRSFFGRSNLQRHPRSLFRSTLGSKSPNTRAVLIDGTDRDYLSNAELGAACDRIAVKLGRPIDVLVFDACLMSSWEILAEVSSAVLTVVASLDELSVSGIDMSRPVAAITAGKGQTNAKEMAETIVKHFEPRASFDTCVAIDLSAPEWATAIGSFKSCCKALGPWIHETAANRRTLRNALQVADSSVVKFWGGGLADVSALVKAITEIPNIPATCALTLNGLKADLQSCVIKKSLGTDYRNAFGLSIFAPSSASDYAKNRPDYVRLRFSKETGWSDILDSIFDDSRVIPQFTSPTLHIKSNSSVTTESPVTRRQSPVGRSEIPLEAKHVHAKHNKTVRVVKSHPENISGAGD